MGLKIADKVPIFSAKDSNGNHFNIESLIGKKIIIIYFYPKDDTPGCTIQACAFRDQYQAFTDLGAEVIGISSDSISSHQSFVKQNNLPFILLEDKDKKIRHLFGVRPNLLGLIPGRATYVVDKQGAIQMIFNSIKAMHHMQKALDIVRKHQ